MQASFSFTRLGLLIKKQWADHSRLYALAVAAIVGLMAIAFFLWTLPDGNREVMGTYIILLVTLFLGGSIFASMMFADLSQRTTGIYWLSVPATHAEKMVCAILYSQVFFNAVVLIIFFILQPIALSLVKMNPHIQFHSGLARDEFRSVVINIAVGYCAMQALFLLGSVYFQRFSFIKTVVATLLVAFVFFHFLRYVIWPIIPHNLNMHKGLTDFEVQDDKGFRAMYSLPQWVGTSLKYAFQYIWVPVFWAATYFRLKEKEL
jgi:hypothetical protein